ncbi:phosphoadenylyl-sulfate reductase [Winogradskyella vincentii]|uniref:Adenosine 5'-phosphosulfate reductase n=1 Tax=Winogradskyella vincentii TaxID=2877122 RepID=A0ABS7Y4D4_9FLAO|nr:phosphoadenylyl-sulfate reductase [Winogradskyella vincentii]MCA0153553.1 phosphoadenylyl-sulfate reductase [Winogradskyella vincentii]
MFETTGNIASKRTFTAQEIKVLNDTYKPLTARQRIEKLYHDFQTTDVMLTSSFAATSAFLLKLVSDVNLKQEVFFIDTGYHFEETLKYKKTLEEKYKLNVTSISAIKEEHAFTTKDQTWSKNPDFCCSINKVRPLDGIKAEYNIWMSGLMEWQSDHRSSLNIFEQRGNILKFYPLLDISKEFRDAYIKEHKLPFHPLVAKGYHSIGCTHCTVSGEDRSGRWNNNPKTECGLHL